MATINAKQEEKIITLDKWLGLIESEDGDVEVPIGAATICQNWKITRDRNLKRRSGYKVAVVLGDTQVQGIWSGMINNKLEILASCGGKLFKVWDDDTQEYISEELGEISTDGETTFFPFAGVVYIMDGKEYYKYDGDDFVLVDGYRPLIYTSITPSGEIPEGDSMLERVNLLNGKRRIWYSPDGEATEFSLFERNISSVDYVKDNVSGELIDPSTYTFDLINGKVTFSTAPTAGTDTIEIGYSGICTTRSQVTEKKYVELYSGNTDMRVLIYGDGTNQVLYSGMDYYGQASVEYFPDLNQMAIGEANTPVTSLIRHMSTVIAFKPDSTWSVQYGAITLSTGLVEDGFYITPINKIIGNEPMGQVRQVLNTPFSLMNNDLYEWKATGYKAVSMSKDERNAKRISDRIYSTLRSFDMPTIRTYDDNFNQEYYICNPTKDEALVYNYVSDAWYYYNHFPMCCATIHDGNLLFGSKYGIIEIVDNMSYNDNGEAFESIWESGSMNFGTSYRRKFSSEMWVVIKPESRGHVGVTIRTDRKSSFDVKDTDSYLLDFWDIDFTDFSFDVNRSPRTHRHRLKAKKFVFYKLRLESKDTDTSATVISTNFKVRYTGYAK